MKKANQIIIIIIKTYYLAQKIISLFFYHINLYEHTKILYITRLLYKKEFTTKLTDVLFIQDVTPIIYLFNARVT